MYNSLSTQQHAQGTVDGIEQFTDLIKQVLDAAWESDWGEFTAQWPTDNDPNTTPMPRITYKLFHRITSRSMKSLKPHKSEVIGDPDVPGATISIWRQWFDCLLDFGIWGKTNEQAEAVKQRFEDMMLAYAGFFKEKGVSELLFMAEMEPSVSSKWRQDIPHRALRYLVRIERITPVRSALLTGVIASVNVDRGEGDTDETRIDIQEPRNPGNDSFLKMYYEQYPENPSGQ